MRAIIRTRTALAGTLATLAAAALAPVHASTAPPRIVGTPTLSSFVTSNTDNARCVTVGALVHLDRRFANVTEQQRYSVVAAPHLVTGEVLPDELFGGSSLRRFTPRPGAWYQAEAVHSTRAAACAPAPAGTTRSRAATASSAL